MEVEIHDYLCAKIDVTFCVWNLFANVIISMWQLSFLPPSIPKYMVHLVCETYKQM